MSEQDQKTFDDFFEEALNEDEGKVTTEEEEIKPTEEKEEVEETVVATVESTPEVTPQEEVTVDPSAAELLEKIRVLEQQMAEKDQKMASWEGRIRKETELRKAAEKKLEEKSEGFVPTEGADDEEILNEFLTEFPDLKRPIQVLIRQEAKAIASGEVGDLRKKVETLEASAVQTKEDAHWDTIRKAHPDFEDLRDSGKLGAWLNAQKPMLQRAYDDVCKNGTADEIIEMLNDYKEANKPKQTNVGKRKPQVESLLAVPGRTGGPPPAKPGADDFDSAWDEATT